MPNLQGLRRRIRAIKSTRQITKAMKMVSAAKLRRSQERVTAARPYTKKILEIFSDLKKRAPDFQHPLLGSVDVTDEHGPERMLLLLITGDKGLCGPFNTNLSKKAQDFLREHGDSQVELVIVGRRGADYFRRRKVSVRRTYIGITGTGRVSNEDARRIAREIVEDFSSEENHFDSVFLIYSRFKSALSQTPVVEQLLPVGGGTETESEAPAEGIVDYLYEQPPDEVFGSILPRVIEVQVLRALLESVASEMGARMTAMEAASRNADEVIDKLTLNMNRVRQAAITREIIEVVSGAGAL
jgi:F-type H+-transporting ATPase subunit gamma